MLNSALLTIAAIAYNNCTGTSYPHRAHAPAHPHAPKRPVSLTDADFDAVLADYGEALGRDDLRRLHEELIGRAEASRQEGAARDQRRMPHAPPEAECAAPALSKP